MKEKDSPLNRFLISLLVDYNTFEDIMSSLDFSFGLLRMESGEDCLRVSKFLGETSILFALPL